MVDWHPPHGIGRSAMDLIHIQKTSEVIRGKMRTAGTEDPLDRRSVISPIEHTPAETL